MKSGDFCAMSRKKNQNFPFWLLRSFRIRLLFSPLPGWGCLTCPPEHIAEEEEEEKDDRYREERPRRAGERKGAFLISPLNASGVRGVQLVGKFCADQKKK